MIYSSIIKGQRLGERERERLHMQKQEEKKYTGGKSSEWWQKRIKKRRKEEKKTLRNGVCQQKHFKSAQGSSSYVEQWD